MRWAPIGLAAILVLAATATARADNAITLTEIPPGYTIGAKAATLETLKDLTSPTLVYAAGAGYEFVWTAKAADGTRYFTHATAYYYWSERTPKTPPVWVIFNATSKPNFSAHARLTAAVDPTGDANKPVLSEDRHRSLSVVVASAHPRHGTLYQMSLDHPGDGMYIHNETRVFIMHDPEHGWRFVGSVTGNLLIDGDGIDHHEGRHVSTEVTWSGVAEAPVRIACNVTADYQFDKPTVTLSGGFTLAGSLPLTPRKTHYELMIQKGNTLSGLAKILAEWHGNYDDSYDDCYDMAGEVRQAVLALNPGLKADMLHIGSKINIPDIFGDTPWPTSAHTAATVAHPNPMAIHHKASAPSDPPALSAR